MRVQHPLDADAAWLLGKIFEEKSDWHTASSFYQDVIVSHPDAKVATLALLGRVLPRQADEFTCSRCFLVHHRSQLASEAKGQMVCRECAA